MTDHVQSRTRKITPAQRRTSLPPRNHEKMDDLFEEVCMDIETEDQCIQNIGHHESLVYNQLIRNHFSHAWKQTYE